VGKTSIEWTDASWNHIVGCTEVSPGCANCYAARLSASRLAHNPAYKGLATIQTDNPKGGGHMRHVRWTGNVRVLPERIEEPLHWRKPRRIFVCDMTDLFHQDVPKPFICKMFGVIARCSQHTFQILTKRPENMLAFFNAELFDIGDTVKSHPKLTPQQLRVGCGTTCNWPLPNVWLGVSVENQTMANKRIPLLLDTPAAVRFISAEPLRGPIDFGEPLRQWCRAHQLENLTTSLDWIIAGGESGPHARPMQPDWPRQIRDWCQQRGDICQPAREKVPFFFKQWGEFAPIGMLARGIGRRTFVGTNLDGQMMLRYGKKLAGRLLDGREWNEFPTPTP